MDFDVKRIAKLAKIKITDEEEIKLEKNIQDIIHMLENLDKVDLEINQDEKLEDILLNDLPPMKYREDIINSSMSNNELVRNAPKSLAGCIVVPKIVESEGVN